VRVGGEFQHMRHHHQIDTGIGYGQAAEFAGQRHAGFTAGSEAQSHAVSAQKIAGWQPKLHRVVSKYVGNDLVNARLLPFAQILAAWRCQPLRQLSGGMQR
jgi:hypothetical protein